MKSLSMQTNYEGASQSHAALILETGEVLWGHGVGAEQSVVGELCFNTALIGYQEILTDPSHAEQIITFTAPHIGNVGVNSFDLEHSRPVCKGGVFRENPTDAPNYRSDITLSDWMDLPLEGRILFAIGDPSQCEESKLLVLEAITLGYEVCALDDTASAWGKESELLEHIWSEHQAIRAIRAGEVKLLVSIDTRKGSTDGARSIRRAGLEAGLPCFTRLTNVTALNGALTSRSKRNKPSVNALQRAE